MSELNKYSKVLTQDVTQPAAQAMYYGIGFTDEDLKKAGGLTTYNELTYTKPFIIDRSCHVRTFAVINDRKSKPVIQSFYKVTGDKSIRIISKVNPMYTAGGPDALIDSIQGTGNWKTEEWQGYYDQDFEAVIDLKQTRHVNYIGVHVLQDISPWILYPKQVIFSTSEDGKNFVEMSAVQNEIDQRNGPAQTQLLGTNVNVHTRYIRVKAINGGHLPSWHESAGSPSHIFIDEVIVK